MLHEPSTSGHEKGRERRGFGRLRKLPSKRWQAAYVGPDSLLHTAATTFEDKDTAIAWLSGERRLIQNEEWRPPSERTQRRRKAQETLASFASRWLEGRQVAGRPLKQRTKDHYQDLLDRLILPSLGRRLLVTLTPDDVEDWYESLDSSTPTYRAHAYGLLRTILGSVDPAILPVNPARIRGAGASRSKHSAEPLTVAEIEALADAMPAKRRALVLLGAWCALRFGELAELRRRDIDLTNGVVRVRRGVVRTRAGIEVGTPKSDAGVSDVAIPPHIIDDVRGHLSEHVDKDRDALIFPGANGGHLAPSTLYGKAPKVVRDPRTNTKEFVGGHGFYRARLMIGRPTLHFHDLRHTGLTLAAQAGGTSAELGYRGRQSTLSAAMRYQHAAKGRDKAIAEALSKMAES